MKLISWVVFIVISVFGYQQTIEAPPTPVPAVTTTTTTMPSLPPILRSKASNPTTTTTTAPPTTTTTTTIPGIDTATYPELWQLAIQAGWPTELLPTLDIVIHRESRGLDVIGNGSYGVTQIQWSVHRQWITAEGLASNSTDLLDPLTNLTIAHRLFQIAEEAYGCGWQPWYMSLKTPYDYCK